MNKANVMWMWLLVLFAGCKNENSPEKSEKLTSSDMKIYEDRHDKKYPDNKEYVPGKFQDKGFAFQWQLALST